MSYASMMVTSCRSYLVSPTTPRDDYKQVERDFEVCGRERSGP